MKRIVMNTAQLKALLQTLRPAFLVLTPVCVFLGVSTAYSLHAPVNIRMACLVLLGALSAHISVNTLNEYYDFKSGLDLSTNKTAFSGGSGALPAHPALSACVLRVGLLALLITLIIGLYFVWTQGTSILPIGLVGIILVITYTQWLNRYAWLCLLAAGLGFGVLMVLGTHSVLTHGSAPLPWLISLVPFFLVNNLLLLNQYPDIQADKQVGRKTFPIAFGIRYSNVVYALFMLAAYSIILLLYFSGTIPPSAVLALGPMVLSLYSLDGARKHGANIGHYPRYLGTNVAATLLTPLLLGISLVYN